jgi:hypothetical protein
METNPNGRYSVAARRATVDTTTDPKGENKAMSLVLLISAGKPSINNMLLIPSHYCRSTPFQENTG